MGDQRDEAGDQSQMRPVTTALLLDMDDTLIDTRAAMVAAGAVAVARLWPEAGDDVHHAAGVHFHGDPGGFFGRFTTGELSFAEMREARVADLVDVFSFRAIDDVNLRFQNAYARATGLEGGFAVVATGTLSDSESRIPGRFTTPASCCGQPPTRRSTSVTTSRSTRSQPRTRGCMPCGCGDQADRAGVRLADAHGIQVVGSLTEVAPLLARPRRDVTDLGDQ